MRESGAFTTSAGYLAARVMVVTAWRRARLTEGRTMATAAAGKDKGTKEVNFQWEGKDKSG